MDSATSGEKRVGFPDREKLANFVAAADHEPEFAEELPRFQAEVWKTFNPYEIAGYLLSLKPKERKRLRKLLYLG